MTVPGRCVSSAAPFSDGLASHSSQVACEGASAVLGVSVESRMVSDGGSENDEGRASSELVPKLCVSSVMPAKSDAVEPQGTTNGKTTMCKVEVSSAGREDED